VAVYSVGFLSAVTLVLWGGAGPVCPIALSTHTAHATGAAAAAVAINSTQEAGASEHIVRVPPCAVCPPYAVCPPCAVCPPLLCRVQGNDFQVCWANKVHATGLALNKYVLPLSVCVSVCVCAMCVFVFVFVYVCVRRLLGKLGSTCPLMHALTAHWRTHSQHMHCSCCSSLWRVPVSDICGPYSTCLCWGW
jgi:hypothetical protein